MTERLAWRASQGEGRERDDLAEEYTEVPNMPVSQDLPSVAGQLGDAAAQALKGVRQALPGASAAAHE